MTLLTFLLIRLIYSADICMFFAVYHNMFTQNHHSKVFIHKKEEGPITFYIIFLDLDSCLFSDKFQIAIGNMNEYGFEYRSEWY